MRASLFLGEGWTHAKGLVAAPAVEVPVVKLLSSEGTALLAAISGLERAHESDVLMGSFFTHHLVAAVRGAAEQTASGEITLQAAFRYAEQRTVRDSVLFAGVAQHPSFDLNIHGRSDAVLAQVTAGGGGLEVAQHEGPLSLVQLASGVTVLELPPGDRRVKLAIEPGRYLLRREGEGRVWAREIDVRPGETTEIDEASLTLVGRSLLAAKEVPPAQEPPPEPAPAREVEIPRKNKIGPDRLGLVRGDDDVAQIVGYRMRVRYTSYTDHFSGTGQLWMSTDHGAASESYTSVIWGITASF